MCHVTLLRTRGSLDLPFSAHEPAKRVHHVVHLPEVGLDDEERNPEGDDDDAVVSDHLAERPPGDEGDQEEGGVHQAGRQVEAEDAEDPFGRKRTTLLKKPCGGFLLSTAGKTIHISTHFSWFSWFEIAASPAAGGGGGKEAADDTEPFSMSGPIWASAGKTPPSVLSFAFPCFESLSGELNWREEQKGRVQNAQTQYQP